MHFSTSFDTRTGERALSKLWFSASRVENILAAGAFLGLIVFLSVVSMQNIVFGGERIAVEEKRQLAQLPQIKGATDLADFAANFQSFYNDRFAFRLPLTAIRNYLNYAVFSASGCADVAIGRSGWLFYAKRSAGVLEASVNFSPFSEEALSLWSRMLQYRRDSLAAQGIQYLFFIAPEKGTIYAEFLPRGCKRNQGQSRASQLLAYLKRHSDVETIDAASLLLAEKAEGTIVYLKTDSHWNDVGAGVIAKSLLSHLSQKFPAIEKFAPDDFISSEKSFSGDLTDLLGQNGLISELAPQVDLVRATATVVKGSSLPVSTAVTVRDAAEQSKFATYDRGSDLPRAYVLRDSFGSRLAPILSERFSYVEYNWTHEFDLKAIIAAKPNVVIEELAERHLFEGYPDNIPMFLERDSENVRDGQSRTSLADRSNAYQAHPQALKRQNGSICKFGERFDVQIAKPKRTTSGVFLKFLWHSNADQKLDYKYAFTCLDDGGKILGGHDDMAQDICCRKVQKGEEWSDEIEIPAVDLNGCTQIGLVLYKGIDGELPVREGRSDSGNLRLLIGLQ